MCLCEFRWQFLERVQELSRSVSIWWLKAAKRSSNRPFFRVYRSLYPLKHGKHTHTMRLHASMSAFETLWRSSGMSHWNWERTLLRWPTVRCRTSCVCCLWVLRRFWLHRSNPVRTSTAAALNISCMWRTSSSAGVMCFSRHEAGQPVSLSGGVWNLGAVYGWRDDPGAIGDSLSEGTLAEGEKSSAWYDLESHSQFQLNFKYCLAK